MRRSLVFFSARCSLVYHNGGVLPIIITVSGLRTLRFLVTKRCHPFTSAYAISFRQRGILITYKDSHSTRVMAIGNTVVRIFTLHRVKRVTYLTAIKCPDPLFLNSTRATDSLSWSWLCCSRRSRGIERYSFN